MPIPRRYMEYTSGIHAEKRVEFMHANGFYDETASLGRLSATRLVSQALTLFTTPVVYLYLDQFSLWMKRRRRGKAVESFAPDEPARPGGHAPSLGET